MSKVAIIGGGAAGMLCGVYAARRGHQVHILEKNEKLGKKLFITGKVPLGHRQRYPVSIQGK